MSTDNDDPFDLSDAPGEDNLAQPDMPPEPANREISDDEREELVATEEAAAGRKGGETSHDTNGLTSEALVGIDDVVSYYPPPSPTGVAAPIDAVVTAVHEGDVVDLRAGDVIVRRVPHATIAGERGLERGCWD